MQMIRYTIALLAVDFINLSNALNSLETTFSGTTFRKNITFQENFSHF